MLFTLSQKTLITPTAVITGAKSVMQTHPFLQEPPGQEVGLHSITGAESVTKSELLLVNVSAIF